MPKPEQRGELDRAASELAQRRIRELERQVESLTLTLDQVADDLERIERSAAWRWGHRLAQLGWRLRGRRALTGGAVARARVRIELARGAGSGLLGQQLGLSERQAVPKFSAAAVARAEGPLRDSLAGELRRRLGAVPMKGEWPMVSIVVLSRDGTERLARLLTGLREVTDYPEFDLVVIDNGSVQALEPGPEGVSLEAAGVPMTMVRNEVGESFAAANNAAAELTSGELLLFLNDDIEPFEPGWLKELVASVLPDGVGAAGATLLHVAQDPELTTSGWIVQHRAICFRREGGLEYAFNLGDGEDLFSERLGAELEAPAVTGACLLIRREVFAAVGGFSEGYRFGTEDVDLGLTMRSLGWAVRGCGRSVTFHRESATQDALAREEVMSNRLANRTLFHERWGPRLARQLLLARLNGDFTWTTDPLRVGITLSSLDEADGWGDWCTGHELGDALAESGTRVTYLPLKGRVSSRDDLDVIVALLDGFDLGAVSSAAIVLAWVRNWTDRWVTRPWLGRVDRFLVSSSGSAALLERSAGVTSVPFPLATNPERFQYRDGERRYDYVLTTNRWGAPRAVEQALRPSDNEQLAIFGRGWAEVPALAGYSHGPVSYDQLPAVYANARLVLDDTSEPTLPYGAVNARVFDALASGALVATNCAEGVTELFDADFPVWSNAADLRELLDDLLGDEPRRRSLTDRYRQRVLAEHTYASRAETLLGVVREQAQAMSFVIRIGAPDWERAERWGDLHFARSLEHELKRRGHRTLIQVLPEWNELTGCSYDVSIVLHGRSRHRPRSGQLNVLWVISHPDELTDGECDGYDLVAVASSTHAAAIAAGTSTPVFVLEQATDPRRFWPEPDPELAHDVVFVGNSRGVRRPALEWLLDSDHDVAVWGGGWDGLTRVEGEFLAGDDLRRVYSSAKVVVADHWPDMRDRGYIANRVYDALACGTVVLSDAVTGVSNRFGDAVPVYGSREDLYQQLALLLADDEDRRRRVEQGRRLVLDSFTFERRVDVLLARIRERCEVEHRRFSVTSS